MATADHELLVTINGKLDDALKLSERLAVVETRQTECPARVAAEQGNQSERRMLWVALGMLVLTSIGLLFQLSQHRQMWSEIRAAQTAPANKVAP